MRTVAICSAKGGCAKTTTTSALAVQAVVDGCNVAMFDLNEDQGNLTQWWNLRGEPMNPRLMMNLENIPRDKKAIEGMFDWLFIDTPPMEMDVIHQAIVIADAVIIPVRSSIFDIMSVESVVELCRRHNKPFKFLLSAVDNSFKPLNAQAAKALAEIGDIFGNRITHRMAYVQALSKGKTGPEISKELSVEIAGLWSEVKRLAGAP